VTEDTAAARRRLQVARAMKVARKRYGTMRSFTTELRRAIGWPSLSMAAVYAWEAGSTRIPAVALVAAAELTGIGVDTLLDAARPTGDADGDVPEMHLATRLNRLEDRLDMVESRLPE
jgi:hypothetical protein